MSAETMSAEQAAADEFARDVDLDLPLDDQQKQAIRWLISQGFLAGEKWQKKQTDNSTKNVMQSIKQSAEFWLQGVQ